MLRGAINECPVLSEFDCLVDPDSEWLTVPAAVVAGIELDTRPPKFPTYQGICPADFSRFELQIHRGPMRTMLSVSDLQSTS